MTTTAQNFEKPITKLPDIPETCLEDGNKLSFYYDKLANETDEDLVNRLKTQLDSLLIFAGLFAGVNGGFLALTLPMMRADPSDDTNALLLQLVKGGNATINSEVDLPSASFHPPPAICRVNMLFAVSLASALMASFLAVLGQQWLVRYRKRSGAGVEVQRVEQLCRQLGAQRWHLELILDDVLPSLLQIGLAIFCVSFVIYLHILNGSMSFVIAAIVGATLTVVVGAAACATWDQMCPYQNSLSHLLCWVMGRMKPTVVASVWLLVFVKAYIDNVFRRGGDPEQGKHNQRNEDLETSHWKSAQEITSNGLERFLRKGETITDVRVTVLKRVLLTSGHPPALIHAAINVCAFSDKRGLQQLLSDAHLLHRLHRLYRIFDGSLAEVYPEERAMCFVTIQALALAIHHLALSVGTIEDLLDLKERPLATVPTVQPQAPLHISWRLPSGTMGMSGLPFEDGDLERCGHLQLLGVMFEDFVFYSTSVPWKSRWSFVVEKLGRFPSSLPLLRTLTYAIEAYALCHRWDSGKGEGGEYERLSQLFELAKITYASRNCGYSNSVPFLSDALQILALDTGGKGPSELHQVCMSIFGHAVNLLGPLQLEEVLEFDSLGTLWGTIERDVRNSLTSSQYRDQLLEHRSQCVHMVLSKIDSNLSMLFRRNNGISPFMTGGHVFDNEPTHGPHHRRSQADLARFRRGIDTLCRSLAETVHYVRGYYSAGGLRNPEVPRAALERFKRVLYNLPSGDLEPLIQDPEDQPDESEARFQNGGGFGAQDLQAECHEFEAWINACVAKDRRLNRDPELCWCPHKEE
ncbi:hypothetical protein M407DRAFT_20468 [Tulasnella calospora MUT 4182]|uniref:DUF6535 domain-containing protein n=1 Tax=Tulasnella calospora MUT 4182 TaxID=1051891 RepID=A0A0C3QFX8_9AGAM|nr:hypothetical protein M407DRAFT_20468 [Tulasnella calospora MUT 4182]